ncbi:hypothetical protein PR202_ga15159 [Eleusine coracana subsp. coracana]|uniref:Uncharacterized protein n=1 Tax=Eleusine coracana subsp. coracana TaxID=191504 RepID=A0AAV5CJ61_ELECO|nr:hypothetical protein PR202_ga15159 [Eleusine coracana subsp. coracana]
MRRGSGLVDLSLCSVSSAARARKLSADLGWAGTLRRRSELRRPGTRTAAEGVDPTVVEILHARETREREEAGVREAERDEKMKKTKIDKKSVGPV